MKRFAVLLLSVLLVLTGVGCGHRENANLSVIEELMREDFALEPLTGEETELQVLYNSAYLSASGYVDQFAENTKSSLLASGTGKNGVMQYFISKALHNINVKNNGLRINYQDWGWADSLTQKLTTAFVSGSGPSVIIGESQITQYAKDGLLKAFPDELAAYVREHCIGAAYREMEVNGKIYGVQFMPSVTMMFWNKTILRRAGVEEQIVEHGPADWEQFQAVSAQVKAAGVSAGGVYLGNDAGGYLRSYPFLTMNGGGLFDGEGNLAVDSAANRETLAFFRSLQPHSNSGMLSYSENSQDTAFYRSKLAFIEDGAWRLENAVSAGFDREDIGYGFLPSPDGETPDTTLLGSMYFAVPNFAQNEDAAWKFIRSLLSEEVQKQVARFNLRAPVLRAVGESAEFAQWSPLQKEVYDLLDDGLGLALPTFAKNNTEIWQTYGEAVKKSVTTTEDIAQLLAAAKKTIEGYLR